MSQISTRPGSGNTTAGAFIAVRHLAQGIPDWERSQRAPFASCVLRSEELLGYRLIFFDAGATEPRMISSLWNTLVLGDRCPSSRKRRSSTSAALLAISATGWRTAVSCGLTMLIHGTSSKATTDMSFGNFIPAALSATNQPSARTLLAAKIAVGGRVSRSTAVAASIA